MLRIRTGRRWTRERGRVPRDGVSVEVDGLALVVGAENEPLVPVLDGMLAATRTLAAGQRVAECSLPDAGQVFCLLRTDDGCTLRVVTLGRLMRLVRRVRLDWEEWREGVVSAAARLLEDLESTGAPASRARPLSQGLTSLARPDRPPAARVDVPLAVRWEPPGGRGLRVALVDEEGLLDAPAAAPVSPLLVEGRVELRGATPPWTAGGPPLLALRALVHAGEEVQRALAAREPEARLELLDGPSRVDTSAAAWTLGPGVVPWTAGEVAAVLLGGGAGAGRALQVAVPTLRRNALLDELVRRAEAGLALLRPATGPGPQAIVAPVREPRRTRALRKDAAVRRLRFVEVLAVPAVAGAGAATLLGTVAGPVVVTERGVDAHAWDGTPRPRHAGRRGAAVGPDGTLVVAGRSRLLGFDPGATGARWLRPHDGAPLDPVALETPGALLVQTERRAVRALERSTGAERWVHAPARTRRLHVALAGDRLLAATDAGVVSGLSLDDGTVRFRVAAPVPLTCPPRPWGRIALALGGRGERTVVVAIEVATGEVRWVTELGLSDALPPVAAGARAWIAGTREGRPTLVCLDGRGAVLWERPVPVPERPAGLVRVGVEAIVTGNTGAAVRVGRDGRPRWRLGAAGPAIPPLAPALERAVLCVPGATLRTVDVRSGRTLASLAVGTGLRALAVGPRLEVATLDEAGDLRVLRLSGHLAVVPDTAPSRARRGRS